MTLVIKQLVIKGEVIEDTSFFSREHQLSMEKVKEMIEQAKKEMKREYQEKLFQFLEHAATR